MQLTKVAAVFSFFMALAIGVAAVFFADSVREVAVVQAPSEVPSAGSPTVTPVKMEKLLGKWTGYWGEDSDECTIEITRVKGQNFYGTLKEGGAEIALTGTLDQKTRKVTIHETKVLALGEYEDWSLGEDTGELSDGHLMSGTGNDEWSEYTWAVSHDK
ncbi:MAG: hypothetical protein ABI999_01795 [Acidobacteriota bacterium]